MIRHSVNILVGLIFVLFPTVVSAVVFAPYNITEDTVWTSSSGPYIITGAVIYEGATLTIEPGTIVKFSSKAPLRVYGTLNANGALGEEIYFTSIKDDEVGGDTNGDGDSSIPDTKDWSQIKVFSNGSLNLNHTILRYGGGMNCPFNSSTCRGSIYIEGGDVFMENSKISYSSPYGIFQQSGSTLISNSEISFNNIGIYAIAGDLNIDNSSIQNNSTGVISAPTVIHATNNWWGDATGPYNIRLNPDGLGELVYGNILFDPWLGAEPSQEINPVIIVPGILGSWEKNGEWVMDPVLHSYDDLIDTLILNGYEKGIDLFTLPYDWKNSNVDTALLLDEKISEIKIICGCEKVDIVAHSMGGLVSRYYIQSDDYDNDVDQLIFLGTPHLGSPKSYLMWEGGEVGTDRTDSLIKFIYTNEAKKNAYNDLFDYARNRPITSIQQLLPTFDYLMEYESSVMRVYPNLYPRNRFLEDLNQDVNNLLNSGVNITNIVGINQNTISKIKVVGSTYLPKWGHGYPFGYYEKNGDRGLVYSDGDRTVTTQSAGFVDEDLNILGSKHRTLPKNGQSLIFEKLTGNAPTQVSDKFTLPNVKLLIIKILSPVDVQVIAPDGKKIGKDFNLGVEINEIEGAFYSGFETDNEYITIINPLDGDYSVVTQGTDNGGEYTVAVGVVTDTGVVENDFISYILPNNTEEISIMLGGLSNSGINIIEETNITLNDLILHIEQVHSLGWITNSKLKKELIKTLKKIIKEQKEGEEEKDEHREYQNDKEDKDEDEHKNHDEDNEIRKILEKKFLKKLDRGFRSRKINEEGYNLLKEDVNLFINNL